MLNLGIEIKELKIENYSRKDNTYDLIANFEVNGNKDNIVKRYDLGKAENLAGDLINSIREYVKNKNKVMSRDPIEGIVIIRYIKELEEIEEQVMGFFKKIEVKIKDFKNQKYGENFLTRYKTIDGFSQKL